MSDLFINFLGISLRAAPALLLVFVLRLALHRAPAGLWRPMWWGTFFRLACPLALTVPVALRGGAAMSPRLFGMTYFEAGTAAAVAATPPGAVILAATPLAPETPALAASPAFSDSTGTGLLAALWLAGAALVLGWELFCYLRFRSCLVGAVKLRENIWLADHLSTPVVMGVLRPRIYLPSSLAGQELQYVVLHEQGHIRWGDPCFKLLASLLLALHWFNPLAWIAYHWACRDLEAACDEGVLRQLGDGARQDYAASLLSFAVGRRISVAGPFAFGSGDTKGRIRRVMTYRRPARFALTAAKLTAALALVLTLLGPIPELTAAGQDFVVYDSFSYALQPGKAQTAPLAITVHETTDFHYLATWSPTGLRVEVALSAEEEVGTGNETVRLAEGVGGSLAGVFEDVPPGEYRVIVRSSDRNLEYAATADRESLEITGAAAFGWQEGGVWQQMVLPTMDTVTFPAYQDGREDYNAVIYDTTPFRVTLDLPEGWSVRVPPVEERRASYGFTPLWLYQGEEYAGSIGFNTFELYPDVPPENFYRMVYNQLMLGSGVNWDNDYKVASQWESGCSATVQIMERLGEGGADSPVSMRPGVLACDRDRLVYVAIDLQNGRLSAREIQTLAQGLRFYSF